MLNNFSIRAYFEKILLLSLGIILLTFLNDKKRESVRSNSCQYNTKEIGLCLNQYVKDYDDHFPPIGSASVQDGIGWIDQIQPYMKGYTAFQCISEPTAPTAPAPTWYRATDYWMNANLDRLAESSVKIPSLTLLVGEGIGTPNSHYSLASFPAGWTKDSNSPMFRHMGGANYLFVDGHVKWLRPDEVKNFGNRPNPFALR